MPSLSFPPAPCPEKEALSPKKTPAFGIHRVWTRFLKGPFLKLDRALDGTVSFFFKHWGKTRFMLAMSKKAQVFGLERLFLQGPKAFLYFFLFYLIRDTILYLVIPYFIARGTSP